MSSPPRIYLAGKIRKNDWRSDVVGGYGGATLPYDFANESLRSWPSRGTAAGDAVITGPWFIGCDHGCTHEQMTHALTGGCIAAREDYPRPIESARGVAVRLCINAIEKSDLIYAWLDDITAYGTIAEIGYAVGLKKRVIVATPDCDGGWVPRRHGVELEPDGKGCECTRHGETWFVTSMPGVEHVYASDALDGYGKATAAWRSSNITFDSPVEKTFWEMAERLSIPALNGLVPQHQIGRYRVDFAIPDLKFGIEVDGLAYHNGQKSFIADRQRQRHLESEGWRIVRFAAKEVMDNATECVQQAGRIVTSR